MYVCLYLSSCPHTLRAYAKADALDAECAINAQKRAQKLFFAFQNGWCNTRDHTKVTKGLSGDVVQIASLISGAKRARDL